MFLMFFGLIVAFGKGEALEHHTPGSQVTLVGTVRCEVFPGPPNYGETPEIDRPEVACFLELSVPFDLQASSGWVLPESKAQEKVTRVQLVISGTEVWKQIPQQNLEALAWQNVVAKGRLETPSTAHHRALALLVVTELSIKKR
ncbi:hypothetical protein [Candidatus Hadarchaeum sp.]|uniref:hypothetical protein n=1 Tax=Candidatus Hadarchaeum sp. TaxID=2883567 RepID=UPI003D108303